MSRHLFTVSQGELVSSGAIAAGRGKLNFPQLPKNLPAKQMLAAIGQPRLMALYEQIFGQTIALPAIVSLPAVLSQVVISLVCVCTGNTAPCSLPSSVK